jgi:polyhydroxyalkanoate synthesis regulator phasin
MNDILKKAVSLGFGVTAVGREKAQKFVDEMIDKGVIVQNESKEVVNQLIQRGEEQKNESKRIVHDEIREILADLDVATKQDLKNMESRLKSFITSSTPPTNPPAL